MAVEASPVRFDDGTSPARPRRSSADAALKLALAAAGVVCVLPILAVAAGAVISPTAELTGGLGAQLWTSSLFGLAALLVFGGGGAIALGATAAWLVSTTNFPGRDVFSWLLATPLALPAYILAFAYGAMTGPGGAAPIGLTGIAGAAFVYAVGFFPYVYLATRAALETRSSCALEAARTLGLNPAQTFIKVGLPLAWPGLAAGGALALMEIAADYGAAAYFGAPTLSTGLFRAWFSYGDPRLALQIAAGLILTAGVLLILERRLRGARAFAPANAHMRPLARTTLSGAAAALAAGFCVALFMLGAGAPALWLVRLAAFDPALAFGDVVAPLSNTLVLAAAGTALTLALAAPLAIAARHGDTAQRVASALAGAGYAAPGAALALGALAGFAALREAGLVAGLSGAASICALMWAYAARFAGAGAQPIEAGLSRAGGALGGAARTLGAGPWRRFLAIDLPIAGPSLAAAALIVFIEILRELPATLILRPFDFDTLAIRAHLAAGDDRLIEASGPAIILLAAGIGPMILLARRIARQS